MTNVRLITGGGDTPEGLGRAMRNSHIARRWEAYELAEAVGQFLQMQRRASLRKELQSALDIAESTSDKLVRGVLPSVSGHLLMNVDGHFNGALLRTLRGLPEPGDASRRILELTEEIRRLADI